MKNILMKKTILGVGITNTTDTEVLEYIITFIQKTAKKMYVVTPNPEILVYATTHPDFKNILNNAEISLADGVGLLGAGKLLGKNLKSRLSGTDMLEKLTSSVAKKPITVGFLGGKAQVAEKTVECLLAKYPGLKIAFVGPEWGQEGFDLASKLDLRFKIKDLRKKTKENNLQLTTYNSNLPRIDILFVAYGFPKQERWMAENINKLNVRVMMGVGGAFDYISGRVPRAPAPMRGVGLEWLFRLVVQPWRIRRQLALPRFVLLVLKEKLKG